MQDFGLADLGMIAGILTLAVIWWTGAPHALWAKCAPAARALFRGDVLQVHILSSDAGADEDDGEDETPETAVSAAKRNSETAETARRVAEIRAESFTLGETTALARLVATGKLGLTEAVKTGADAKSGEKYQKRSREIKAMVEEFQDKYPLRTPEQERLRNELGIGKP